MRILIVSTTLTVVCVAAGAALASPVSPVAAEVSDGPGYHDHAVDPAVSEPSAVKDSADEPGDASGRSVPGSSATGPAYTPGMGTPTPGNSPTLPTDVTSILPTPAPSGAPTGSPFVPPTGTTTPSGSASPSTSTAPTGTPSVTLSPSPTADPTGGTDPTAGPGGGDDSLLCVILPLLCG
ncbi:MAG TPA: hypothetical protein VGJ41_09925 [Nocardioides sp.]